MTESFEPGRGVQDVELALGFAQAEIQCDDPIKVLEILATAEISHKFLKLRPGGIAFVVPEPKLGAIRELVGGSSVSATAAVAIVTVVCPILREAPGLVARAVAAVLENGITILHSGDMHDRAYFVVPEREGADAQSVLREAASS